MLEGLNAAQREAASHLHGPALVLAGAGSGKTRVITRRIAWLVRECGVPPWGVVAVTFTNKAAGEMRERVLDLLGGGESGPWIGTFHALCLRILRRDGSRIGLAPGFNVYDTDDQLAVVRAILKDLGEDAVRARAVLSRISRAKNAMESAEALERRAFSPEARLAARVFRPYREALSRANAADFDDLLVRSLELFSQYDDVRERYAVQCHQLLVDEYQDTNRPQYLLVRALSSHHGNLFVVGDEDQSIYRFRGAEIRNILDFEHDHPGARVLRLEQNYRSTGVILDAAGAVIANNAARKGKRLWTDNPRGGRIELFRAPDDRAEAVWVAARLRALDESLGIPFGECAVLYRTNAQSRQFEEILRRDRIPYRLIGAVQFYERKEVKDLLAYLRLLANPSDDVSFRRAINVPARGIGAGTLETIEARARDTGLALLDAAHDLVASGALPARAHRPVAEFLALAAELSGLAATEPVAPVLDTLIERLGYAVWLEKSNPGQGDERMDNVRALVSAAAEYWDEDPEPSLLGFLDRSALVSDVDELDRGSGVTLMTIHCAKGLEFRAVFLAGLEENVFPHVRASGSADDLEEERRLCYVAMTRARERLALSLAGFRRFQGSFLPNPPSRFLDEIPEGLLDEVVLGAPAPLREPAAPRWHDPASSAARAAARVAARPASSAAPAALPDRPGPDGFGVGHRVRHPNFGAGRIVAREGSGRALKLTIEFRDHGQKKILPAYTRLQVEG